jgi:microcystin-dependent protein
MTEYNVRFTDFVNKGSLTVDPGTVNTETSLTLTGRNFADYGEIVNTNFLHLLENFANNISPENPVEGQLWYDTTPGVDQLKIYDGARWTSAGGLKKGTSQPEVSSSIIGDLWVDTSNQQLYLYSGSGWILVGPDYAEGNSTGSRAEVWVSTTNAEIPVIVNYVNDFPVSVISYTQFNPKLARQGFPTSRTLYAGINLSNNISGSAAKIYGISQNAENIVDSTGGNPIIYSDIARISRTNIFTQQQRISNNSGLSIGQETNVLQLSVTGTNALITNKSNDGYIALRVNNSLTGIRITNDGKVGIKNENPQEVLDVSGNIKAVKLALTDTTDVGGITAAALTVAGGAAIAKSLTVTDDIDITGNFTGGNLSPTTTGKNIGSSGTPYNNVYANNFYGRLTGELVGNITGASLSAAKLNSTTSFVITGDVTAPSITFDGQTGGLTKTFVTTLSDTYFTGKSNYTDSISGSEEILIRKTVDRPDLGDTLTINTFYKTTVADIVNTIPTFQVGMIMPYAGSTAPGGWRMCNGDPISTSSSDYAPLYAIIGFTYGGSFGSGVFNLPDLRGRFPLGFLDGEPRTSATDEDRVYDDGAADILGSDGGAQRRYITEDQLPQHQHSLQGDNGTQYFATTNVAGTDTGSSSISTLGSDPGTGITITGDVDGLVTSVVTIEGSPEEVGNKITTVPPFLTVNYIIYTGV